MLTPGLLVERDGIEKRAQIGDWRVESGQRLPFIARGDTHLVSEGLHLLRRHQARVVVFVTLEGEAVPFDRVCDETRWCVVVLGRV